MAFTADVPLDLVAPARVLVVPAHPNNFGGLGRYYDRVNEPRALIYHSPEEAVDDTESTPAWFANPQARVSTHYYGDSDGDLYQMVRDIDAAFAVGTRVGDRVWRGAPGRPPWAEAGISYNCRSLSYEIEGYARTMHRTFIIGGHQWRTAVVWGAFKAAQYGISVDREHIMGHEEFNAQKRDPGLRWGFPMDDLVEAIYQATRKPKASPPVPGWRLGVDLLTGAAKQFPGVYDPQGRPHYDVVRTRTGQ